MIFLRRNVDLHVCNRSQTIKEIPKYCLLHSLILLTAEIEMIDRKRESMNGTENDDNNAGKDVKSIIFAYFFGFRNGRVHAA